jgi:hypothetical protein
MKPILFASLALICTASRSAAEERYFVLLHAGQLPGINRPNYAHTWGTFVKRSRTDDGAETVESFTISWLAVDLKVRTLKLRLRPGRNLTCQETIDLAHRNGMVVKQLGPFPVDPELYRIERERFESLERGERLYVASDLFNNPRNETDCNCIYALAGPVTPKQVFRVGTLGFGYKAAVYVKRRFKPFILDDSEPQLWVCDLIGIERFAQMRSGLFP